MNKIIFAIAGLAALMLCSCSKENAGGKNGGLTFSKAEVILEVTGSDGTGSASADFWDMVSFSISGEDFDGKAIKATVTKDNPTWKMTCSQKPEADKDIFASLIINIEGSVKTKESCTMDYSVRAHSVVYDANGKIIDECNIHSDSFKSEKPIDQTQAEKIITKLTKGTFVSQKIGVCYVQNALSQEWMYHVWWEPLKN